MGFCESVFFSSLSEVLESVARGKMLIKVSPGSGCVVKLSGAMVFKT